VTVNTLRLARMPTPKIKSPGGKNIDFAGSDRRVNTPDRSNLSRSSTLSSTIVPSSGGFTTKRAKEEHAHYARPLIDSPSSSKSNEAQQNVDANHRMREIVVTPSLHLKTTVWNQVNSPSSTKLTKAGSLSTPKQSKENSGVKQSPSKAAQSSSSLQAIPEPSPTAENNARRRSPRKTKEVCSTTVAPMKPSEFESWLNNLVENQFNGWEGLERLKQVTDGNTKLEAKHIDSLSSKKMAIGSISKAQYGRAKVSFVSQAIKAAELQPLDTFVDIGSGIGTVVLQVAATIACASAIGIELCGGRHEIALELQNHFKHLMMERKQRRIAESVSFFSGDFREPSNFALCRGADVLFVNNAESIFGMRSVVEGSYTLDWHVARLVCGMRIGSRIVCFEALRDLDHDFFSSCFKREEHFSEPGATSWTSTSMKRTKFFSYKKIGEIWECPRCTFVNKLLRESINPWGESLQDSCAQCEGDPSGQRRAYTMRKRTRGTQ
jgi:hypothetical protein